MVLQDRVVGAATSERYICRLLTGDRELSRIPAKHVLVTSELKVDDACRDECGQRPVVRCDMRTRSRWARTRSRRHETIGSSELTNVLIPSDLLRMAASGNKRVRGDAEPGLLTNLHMGRRHFAAVQIAAISAPLCERSGLHVVCNKTDPVVSTVAPAPSFGRLYDAGLCEYRATQGALCHDQ